MRNLYGCLLSAICPSLALNRPSGVLLALLLTLGLSGAAGATDSPAPTRRPLAEALTPAGTLRPGASGSFDPAGYRVTTNPKSGKLVFQTDGVNDDKWDERFSLAVPLNGKVNAIVVAGNGDIIVGGRFTNAGGNANADRIARWDGNRWHALGSGIGGDAVRSFAEDVTALALAGNGDILVGGDFVDAGGNPAADGIARWDGTTWQPLGSGTVGRVSAIAVTGNGTVLVGGSGMNFSAHPDATCIAAWNGSSWQALGPGLNSIVKAIVVAANGDVLAGGKFTNAGGNANADGVARWNGASWQALGRGLSGNATTSVNALAVAPDGRLYAGGEQLFEGGSSHLGDFVIWNGTNWSRVGDIPVIGPVSVVHVAANGDPVIGGNFTNLSSIFGNNTGLNHLARYTNLGWRSAGFIPGSPVRALAASATGDILIGGDFTNAGGNLNADYVTRLVGAQPVPFGQGLNGTVHAIYATSATSVYVGGAFTDAGGNPNADRIARWNGTNWEALGTGISNGAVKCITGFGGSAVAVGGSFTAAGGNNFANRIAHWDGTSWQAIGSTGVGDGSVEDIAMIGNSITNGLYVGGSFTTTGGGAIKGIGKVVGNTWQQLGGGISFGTVYAVEKAFNGDVVIGGNFSSVDNKRNTNGAARWDGTAWTTVSGSSLNTVYDVNLVGTGSGSILLCGDFARGVLDFDAVVQALSNGTGHHVDRNTRGFVLGGSFATAGGVAQTTNVAQWNGTRWEALGTGLNNTVYAVDGYRTILNSTTTYSGTFAGGAFGAVGDGSTQTAAFGIYQAVGNTAPDIANQTFALNENATNGTIVGTIGASDADAGQQLTYTVVAGGGAFAIADNKIVVANRGLLDFETTPSFRLTVRVTDNGSPARVGAAVITLNLTDVDDTAPVVSLTSTLSGPTSQRLIPVTVRLSESVVSFAAANVSVTNGSLSNFTGSGLTYSFDITPTTSGPVVAAVAAGAVQDAAGNANGAAQFTIAYLMPTAALLPDELSQQVALFPNPAHATVQLKLPSALARQPLTAVLLDEVGRTVLRRALPAGATHTLSLSGLPPGRYVLQCVVPDGIVTKHLIIE